MMTTTTINIIPATLYVLSSHVSGEEMLLVERVCQVTNHKHSFEIKESDYKAWKEDRVLIQRAFPYLNQEQREILVTGWTDAEWNTLFPEEDDD